MKCLPVALAFLGLMVLAGTVSAREASAEETGERDGYARVEGPCGVSFPRDHLPHEKFRTEWWYWTGNLEDQTGRPYGFQLTFFRSRLAPPSAAAEAPSPASPLRASQLWMAHLAVSDISAPEGGRFVFREEAARGAAGLAGAEAADSGALLRLGGWSAALGSNGHELRAEASGVSLRLGLSPLKPPAPHGEDGYSRKGQEPSSASCYYSFTRLAAEGELRLGDRVVAVRGRAWMDHEWSTAMLEPGVAGWDWMGLQLSDGEDLMLFTLRGADGAARRIAGSLVASDGSVRPLGAEDVRLSALDHWRSRASGGLYPSRWRIEIPSAGLDLVVRPRMADQEIRSEGTTGVTYWEGSVSVEGNRGSDAVAGLGYVELTGYASPFEAPL